MEGILCFVVSTASILAMQKVGFWEVGGLNCDAPMLKKLILWRTDSTTRMLMPSTGRPDPTSCLDNSPTPSHACFSFSGSSSWDRTLMIHPQLWSFYAISQDISSMCSPTNKGWDHLTQSPDSCFPGDQFTPALQWHLAVVLGTASWEIFRPQRERGAWATAGPVHPWKTQVPEAEVSEVLQ